MKKMLLLALLTAISFSQKTKAQQPGTLDPTFGDGGKKRLNLSLSTDLLVDMALRGDGKTVGLLMQPNGGYYPNRPALFRWNPDGSPDSTFGKNALAGFSTGSFPAALALQPDGKSLAVCVDSNRYVVVFRFREDGSPDVGFGLGGKAKVVVNHMPPHSWADLALQPDGKIVVLVLGAYDFGGCTFARLNPDGSPDPGFTKPSIMLAAYSLALQPDGKILASGANGAMLRLKPDGNLDNSFGGNGIFENNENAYVFDLAVQPDGKVLASGVRPPSPGQNLGSTFLLRVNADGTKDLGFQPAGFAYLMTIGFPDFWNDLSLQSDGKILLSTFVKTANAPPQLTVARLLPDGSPDAGFGAQGTAVFDFPDQFPAVGSLALRPDGKITVGTCRDGDIGLLQLLPDGSLDSSFQSPFFNIANGDDLFSVFAQQPDGRILAGGYFLSAEKYDFRGKLLRFWPDGSPDSTFRGGDFGTVAEAIFPVFQHLKVQPNDSKIVFNHPEPKGFGLSRLLADGLPDSTFGTAGKAKIEYGTGFSSQECAGVAVLPDGKLLWAGQIYQSVVGGTYKFAFARFLPNGLPDPDFGGGKGWLFSDGVDYNLAALKMALLPDGKILVAGVRKKNNNGFALVARFLPDGSPDLGFGPGGTWPEFALASPYFSILLCPLPDGRVVLAASRQGTGTVAARFLPDGVLDTGFGPLNNGFLEMPGLLVSDFLTQAHGRLRFCARTETLLAGESIVKIGRLLPDGSLDPAFGVGGFLEVGFGSKNSQPLQLLPVGKGKTLLCGIASAPPGSGFSEDFDLVFARFFDGTSVAATDLESPPVSVSVSPNPTADFTFLNFNLKENARVSVFLADAAGRVLKNIFQNEEKPAGENRVEVGLQNLPAGLYWLVVDVGGAAKRAAVQVVKI